MAGHEHTEGAEVDPPREGEAVVVLSEHTRKCLQFYSTMGFIGKVIREAMAYIAYLESRLPVAVEER